MSGNLLVVYSLQQWPLRSSVRDHLYAFRKYSSARVFYLNLPLVSPPDWLRRLRWDGVVYHTSFLSSRWAPELFARNVALAAPLRELDATTVAMPQDEFIHTDLLNDFIVDFEIDHVLSVAPASEIPKIYPRVDRTRTSFSQVLTGYLSEDTATRIAGIVRETPERPIDVGYRAWEGAPWLGRHGMLKRQVSDAVNAEGPRLGLRTDCSTRAEDTLLGDDWFRFLASCKCTVGVEGGASILDHDGSLRAATDSYLAEHPEASFDEVEAACFPGRDGELALFALSPRHLEACATRTAQILVRGDYNGILRAGEHYFELEPDLSNLDEVLLAARDDRAREAVAERAFRDIVASGDYTYRALVSAVERAAVGRSVVAAGDSRAALRLVVNRVHELLTWARVIYRLHLSATVIRVSTTLRSFIARGLAYGRAAIGRLR